MFKDNKLRLLMTLVGFERLGMDDEPDTTWIVPSSLSSKELAESAEVVERHKVSPELEYGDEDNPVAPQDLLRRKALVRPRVEYDDDSGDDDAASNEEEDFLFPAGGPTVRKSHALEDLKKRRRRKVKGNDTETSLDEETREARRKAREDTNLEKKKKIKSDLFVHDSDEDEDEERDRDFFAQEEERRKGQSMRVLEALRSGKMEREEDSGPKSGRSQKRKIAGDEVARGKRMKSSPLLLDSDDDVLVISGGSSSPMHKGILESTEDEAAETPLSSPHMQSFSEDGLDNSRPNSADLAKQPPAKARLSDPVLQDAVGDDSDEDAPVTKPKRSRARAGFIIDSDSD